MNTSDREHYIQRVVTTFYEARVDEAQLRQFVRRMEAEDKAP